MFIFTMALLYALAFPKIIVLKNNPIDFRFLISSFLNKFSTQDLKGKNNFFFTKNLKKCGVRNQDGVDFEIF